MKQDVVKNRYAAHQALNPFFAVVMQGLDGLVDGDHFYDTIATDALFEFLYDFPGWPREIRGRANLIDIYSGYGNSIKVHAADGLSVHRTDDGHVVVLEYEVHGEILRTGAAYDNRFISVVTIENRKIARWRDYMDSLAAWTALNG